MAQPLSNRNNKIRAQLILDPEMQYLMNEPGNLRPVPQGESKFRIWMNSENDYLHRVLVKAKPHEYVDHINGNTLDNRLENLRSFQIYLGIPA